MSNTKHTPGEWKVGKEENDSNGFWYLPILAGEYGPITMVYTDGCGVDADIQTANAKLIAAAPEMYEAMKEFCDRVDRGEVRSTKTYSKFKAILNNITP